MLCVCGLHAVLSPFMNSSWSACRLQPEVKPLPCQQDLLLQLMCSYLLLEEGEQFDLTMDTQKLGGGGECCFYRWQEFRKQFDLPEGGKFHIQASKVCVREAETEVIKLSAFPSDEFVSAKATTKNRKTQSNVDCSHM
uniref:SHSP domain-containing protein n=1 Tax=Pundamilia nyererei TaxID=303518 RepID=A0A3B4H963_9CICH